MVVKCEKKCEKETYLYQARKGGLIPFVVPVYDKGEARAVQNMLKKYRAGK